MTFSLISKSSVLRLAAVASVVAAVSPLAAFAAQKAADKGAADGAQTVSFGVYLPLRNRDALELEIASLHSSASNSYHKWLTPEQFNAKYAPTAAQMAAVRKQLEGLGLTVSSDSPRHLTVTGPASAAQSVLATPLRKGVFANGRQTVMTTGKPVLTGALAQSGATITGLSGRVMVRTHAKQVSLPSNRYSSTGAYWFDDLKQAYQFPSYKVYTGKGTTIGILMSGDYNPSDMNLYFSHEKLATPKFQTVQIDGGSPYDPTNSFETHLDLQQSGGMAPNAKVILYNLPDLSDDSIIDGLSRIVNDNKADVVSMSFGEAEVYYTAPYNGGEDFTYLVKEEDDLFAQGNAQGITFVASSGDSGALAVLPPGCFDYGPDCGSALPGANFPASSPHVVGVGGTNLITTNTGSTTDLNSAYVRESAYADPLTGDIFYGTSATNVSWGSGGGDSILFPAPLFQVLTNTGNRKVRTVPDVAMHMGGCPGGAVTCGADDSVDAEVIGGQLVGVIGTSASAPDFAGLTALAVERFGTRMGNENYYLYALALTQSIGLSKVFHQGIPGFNGLYSGTTRGYNRVLGNGTVEAKEFMLAPLVPSAGVPQTPTNP